MGLVRKGIHAGGDGVSPQLLLTRARQRYAEYKTTAFLQGPARMLLRGARAGDEVEHPNRRARLGEEVDKALQFSLELFSSRSQARCASLHTLPAAWIRRFEPGNQVLELY